MLKPLTLSLGLAVALGMSSVGVAGHGFGLGHGHETYASAQGVMPSEQGVYASEQGCYEPCGPVKKHCGLFDGLKGMLHRPKCYTYEWVLKKKRVRHGLGLFGHGGGCGDVCGDVGCGTCETVYPSGQGMPSAQGVWGSGQAIGGDIYGSGQITAPAYGATQMTAPAYGAGQITAPAAPAADVSTEPPAIPAEAPAANGNQSASAGGLLFLSPAGN